jgi:hypothetical protein
MILFDQILTGLRFSDRPIILYLGVQATAAPSLQISQYLHLFVDISYDS